MEQAEALASEAPRQNVQTTKDDIVRLLHLFKEPTAQWHWTNLYGILNRAELDARKAGSVYSEAANPLNNLAEIFNDYDELAPQNEMVEYESPGVNMRPIKKIHISLQQLSGRICQHSLTTWSLPISAAGRL